MVDRAQTDSALARMQALEDSLAEKYGTILRARSAGFPASVVDAQMQTHDVIAARVDAVQQQFATAYDQGSTAAWSAFIAELEGVERQERAFTPAATFQSSSGARTAMVAFATLGSIAVGALLAAGLYVLASRQSSPRARSRALPRRTRRRRAA